MKLFLLQQYQIAFVINKQKQRVTSCNNIRMISQTGVVWLNLTKPACLYYLCLGLTKTLTHIPALYAHGCQRVKCVYQCKSDSKMLFGAVMRAHTKKCHQFSNISKTSMF